MPEGRTKHYCFVTPRYADGGTVGGAETLIRELAETTAHAGHRVTLLTTCAKDHFTWANEHPPGKQNKNGMIIRFFKVDEDRDIDTFLRIQEMISAGRPVGDNQENLWLGNNVNAAGLCNWLHENKARFDRIVIGPYLFGLIEATAAIAPEKTVLVPCLHDEPFARVRRLANMFQNVRGCIFNTEPERQLAVRLYGKNGCKSAGVVGMGIEDFDADPRAFAVKKQINGPYIVYCGRRELLKGTPLLLDYMDLFRQRTQRDINVVMTGTGVIDTPPDLRPHLIDCGFVSEQEKHEAMAGATAFIHPSVNESLSIVLLEAWLAKTPALVHARGDVLRHQCKAAGGGLWFKDYPQFEAQLMELIDNPPLNAALAEAGRAFVLAEYAPATIEKKLAKALEH